MMPQRARATATRVDLVAIETSGRKNPAASLRGAFLWAIAGQIGYAACQWGMLIAIARLGTPEMVGLFALGFAVAGPIFMFANLQLRAVLATDARQQFQIRDYFGLQLLTDVIGLLAVAGVVAAAGYRGTAAAVIAVVGIAKAVECLSEICYGALQRRGEMNKVGVALLIRGPASLAGTALGVYLSGSVLGGVLGMLAVWILAFVFVDLRLALGSRKGKHSIGRVNQNLIAFSRLRAPIAQLLWLAIPLGLSNMLISLQSNVPRFFVERMIGNRELGIFAALAYTTLVGNTVVIGMCNGANARLAQYYAEGDSRRFAKLLGVLLAGGTALAAAGVVGAWVIGPFALRFLYGNAYASQSELLLWLMAAGGLSYLAQIFAAAMTAARRIRVQSLLYSGAVVLLIAGCLWLIPKYGVNGSAAAMVGANAVLAAAGAVVIVFAVRNFTDAQEALNR